jgi:integrase
MERTGRLEPRDNPSRGLSVPQYAAEKTKRENRAKGYSQEHVAAIYSEVGSQTVRDILYLRAMTSMHGTEIQRIGQGKALLRRIDDASGIVATLTFPHKRGSDHTISLDERAYAVVMRIQATGTVSTTAIHNAVKVAVKRLAKRGIEVEKINPNELRHSFVTWATSMGQLVRPSTGGLSLDDVAAVTGHLSTTTTRRHYLGRHVPPMIKIPLVLAHRDDPEAPTA